MNIVLLILQGGLALHTAVGAVWKFSNSERGMPELRAIPHSVWLAMSAPELICAVALILPAFSKRCGVAAPAAAVCIAVEMLAFCAINLASDAKNNGHMVYWLIVAGICALICYGRLSLRPL